MHWWRGIHKDKKEKNSIKKSSRNYQANPSNVNLHAQIGNRAQGHQTRKHVVPKLRIKRGQADRFWNSKKNLKQQFSNRQNWNSKLHRARDHLQAVQ